MKDERELDVIWMPTFRCNLNCTYCAARRLPQVTHGFWDKHRSKFGEELRDGRTEELPPDEWIRIFSECPYPIRQVAITGGEPSVYRSLPKVLAATEWDFTIDSNLRLHPRTWLKPDWYDRCKVVNAGLQFDPAHEEVKGYWKHLEWLRDELPEASIVCTCVVLWRDLENRWDLAKKMAADIGVDFLALTFDDSFLFNEVEPLFPGPGSREWCDAGYKGGVILPDTAMYRCIGHTNYTVDLLGHLDTEGWGILLDTPEACDTLICTICDQWHKCSQTKESQHG